MPLFRRDPIRKRHKAYQRRLESAMNAMYKGNIRKNAKLYAEAEAIREGIEKLNPTAS